MHDLIKKYPGTVIGVVSKSSPTFKEDLKMALGQFTCNRIEDKIKTYGTRVRCTTPNGYTVVGMVIDIKPWSLPEVDEPGCVIVEYLDGKIGHWRPSYVTFLGEESC